MPVSTTASERRSDRAAMKTPVVLLNPRTGRSEYSGVALDISDHGFRFQTSFCDLSPNDIVDVLFMSVPNRTAHCRVVWVAGLESKHCGQAGFEILDSSASIAA